MSGMGQAVAVAAIRSVLPVYEALRSPEAFALFLDDLGYGIDVSQIDDALLAEIPGAATIVEHVPNAIAAAVELATSDTPGEQVGIIVQEVALIAPAVADFATFDPGATLTGSVFAEPDFWTSFALSIPDYLVVRYLRLYQPVIYRSLRVLGVITDVAREPELPAPFTDQAGTRERLSLDLLQALVTDPLAHLRSTYGWYPGGDIDHARVLTELGGLLELLKMSHRLSPVAEEFLADGQSPVLPATHQQAAALKQLQLDVARLSSQAGGAELSILAVPGASGAAPDSPIDGILVTPSLHGNIAGRIPIDGRDAADAEWFLNVDASANATGAIGLWASPNGFEPHLGGATGALEVSLEARFAEPMVVVGGRTGTRLLLRGLDIDLGLDVSTASETEISARFALAADGGEHPAELIIEAGDGDGFVSSLMGDLSLSVPIGLGVAWSSLDGFSMEGSAGIEVRIPLGLSIGEAGASIELTELLLGGTVGTHDDGPVTARFVVAVTATGQLGPLSVSVKEIGIELDIAPNDQGSITPALGFKPPSGLGIGIDMSPITGGGYLDIDRVAGTYKGLVTAEVLSVGITAIVIVETKRPDVDGWSMFFALFIEIPQIQLGFGFSLNGVGGLAGINRSIDTEALGSAVRSGSLGSVLFPEDPITDAPIIIAELESIFPAANDSYVFGPVVKVGWGTPPIVEVEMGVAIAFGPDGVVVAVLGSITAILPRPELELVALRLDFAGAIDTGKGTLSFDASLHDSHIIGFALAGDMALRASFSDARSFLFSVGGFHPAFTPPAGFPELERMSLGISAGSVIEVSFTCYFAVTSNTVQFGAALDLWAKVSGFEIGGGASFDALIRFSPFELQTNVSMYISVTAVGVDLLGVYLNASLTGPSPWHVIGTAEFKVLGVGKDIRVDKILGTRTPQPAAPTAGDLLSELARELGITENWSVVSPSASGVVFAERAAVPEGETPPLLARPDSTIEIAQTVVPLGVTLDKFGNTSMGDHNRFGVTAAGSLLPSGTAVDWFAPGQFFDVAAKQRLSQPSFEQFEAGLTFGSTAVDAGPGVDLAGGHDEFRVDPEFEPVTADEPTRTAAPRERDIVTAELGAGGLSQFVIDRQPRFELVGSAMFTNRMEPSS